MVCIYVTWRPFAASATIFMKGLGSVKASSSQLVVSVTIPSSITLSVTYEYAGGYNLANLAVNPRSLAPSMVNSEMLGVYESSYPILSMLSSSSKKKIPSKSTDQFGRK